MENNPTFKKEVPSINPKTGLSQDYGNQFTVIMELLQNLGLEGMKSFLKEGPYKLEKYETVYKECKNIVTEQNRVSVQRLDELVDRMNTSLTSLDSIDEKTIRNICNEMSALVYGDNEGPRV